MSHKSHICLVCGFPHLKEAPRSPNSGGGSYEICPACGFQFGVDEDDKGISYETWRKQWVHNGMKWSSQGQNAPADWSPKIHLSTVEGKSAKQ